MINLHSIESRNYWRGCASLLLVIFAAGFAAAAPQAFPPGVKTPDVKQAVQQIIGRTNAFREQHKIRHLKPNAKLMAAAGYFAAFMADTDQYGHEADGNTPESRVKRRGYDYCTLAENLAFQYSSAGFTTDALARDFVSGWENSPPHRRNMLDPNVTEIGVAVAQSPKSGRYYAVQIFGLPGCGGERVQRP